MLAGGVALAGNGGTESPFSLGAGARALGLGTADLVYCHPSVAAYWNPAALALTERYSLEAFHSGLYDSDAGYQYFGFAVPTMDFGSFGIGIFRLGIDGIEKRDANNLYLGQISDSRLGLFLGGLLLALALFLTLTGLFLCAFPTKTSYQDTACSTRTAVLRWAAGGLLARRDRCQRSTPPRRQS